MYGITLAVSALATLAAAAPAPKASILQRRDAVDEYTFYTGDGSAAAGWPETSSWASYDELWDANAPLMAQSCGWNGWGEDNSDQETSDIDTAIRQVSGETGVDASFILSIVMQESKGCVRAPTTNNGVVNPGLMQSHNGEGKCAGVNPCPFETILLMIRDGTAGTAYGDGLQQTLETAAGALGGSDARAHYAAARLYNSGSVNYDDLNDGFTSTACYAVDVANRLTGWTLSASGCAL